MKKSFLFLALGLFFFSCQKDITTTCTCKNPSGGTVYTDTHVTKDKKDDATFKQNCTKKSQTYQTNNNSVITSTVVPCQVS